MSVRNVDRIAPPAGSVFRAEYLRKQRPVILQGLFADQEIDKIRTEAQAAERFGSLSLPVQKEYLTSMREAFAKGAAEPPPPSEMRLSDYLSFVRENPNTRLMCSEKPTPPELLQFFRLPAYDSFDDSISSFFVGNRGNFAHMHFDGDYRHVLFYQVFGRKRFILVPPAEGRKIPCVGNYALWAIENFSEEDKRCFADFTNAYECILEPGETLYLPACIWHYVEYETTGMSYNLRFGRNQYTRFLAKSFHMNPQLQNIAWLMSDPFVVREKYADIFREISEAHARRFPTGQEKHEAIQSLFNRICTRICPGWNTEYLISDERRLSAIYRKIIGQFYQPAEHPAPAENLEAENG